MNLAWMVVILLYFSSNLVYSIMLVGGFTSPITHDSHPSSDAFLCEW